MTARLAIDQEASLAVMSERDLVRPGHMLHAAHEALRIVGGDPPEAALADLCDATA